MAGLTERIARALRAGTVEEAVSRAFVQELGWEACEGALATDGRTRIALGEGRAGRIGVVEAPGHIELVWHEGVRTHRLPIDRERPSPAALGRLALLQRGAAVREGVGGVGPVFDARSMAAEFLRDYSALFERHRGAVLSAKGRPMEEGAARIALNRFLTRVLLIAFLQTKGWLSFRGRNDYLEALYEDWSSSPRAHLFHQRLALVFTALDEPRTEARALLESQIGSVPYIGGGLFSTEQYESEGLAVFPDALFSDLFSGDGLLARYGFSARESAPHEIVVAVTPEAMGAVLGAFLGRGDSPVYEDTASHRKTARRLVAAQLGSLEPPLEPARLREWRDGLHGLHVFDGDCGPGTYLVAALEELTELVLQAEGGDRAAIKRRVAFENLRGLDRDEMAVQVARFRLALALVAGDASPRPLPDLRQVVKRGGALAPVRALPPEGPTVEHKASFEWDPRRGQRSPEMRFGTLRTIAAFLNSEGGTLYIGVNDHGEPVGLEGDFALIADASPCDVFEGKLREAVKNCLDPLPLNGVGIAFDENEGRILCLVTVAAAPGVTYLVHKDASGQTQESVFVRDGNRTIELRGRDRDQFVLSRR
jgi:hypothetical protein